MLFGLTTGWRRKSAAIAAVFYAFCVLAPAASFAFGGAARAAHCMTEEHSGVVKVNFNSDQALNQHSPADESDGKIKPSECCGLVCLTALPSSCSDAGSQPIAPSIDVSARKKEGIAGCDPSCLDRPPISLS